MGAHLAVVFFLVASGCSGYVWCRRIPLPRNQALRVLTGLVLWELFELVPVQLLAAMQIAGLVSRVTVPMVAMVQAIILAGSLAWAATHRAPSDLIAQNVSIRRHWPRYLRLSAAVLACSYLVFAADLFTSFPIGPDAIAYHEPMALRWLQTGSLAIPASRAWRFSLPGNTEIGMMLLLATGSDSSVVVVNWIALAVLVIATYLLAKRMSGGNAQAAATIAMVVLSIPIVEFQAFSAYVDLYGTAFLLAAVTLFLYRNRESENGGNQEVSGNGLSMALVFLSAAACGISLGTKPIYYLYGLGYGAWVALGLWRQLRERKPVLVKALLLIGAGLMLPSLFWFGRAIEATRNPVFPMQVAVHGHVLWPGYPASKITDPKFDENFVRSRAEWFIYPWTEWLRNPGYLMIPYGEGSGVGAVFAAFVPLGLLFLAHRVFRGGGHRDDAQVLLVLLVALLAWWFVLNRLPRFGLPILIMACVLATPLVAELEARRGRVFGLLLVLALIITCGISSFVPLHSLLGRVRTRRWSRSDFYGYPAVLDRLPGATCVLNATKVEEKNLALAGKGLRNCVVPGFEVPSPLTAEFLREHNVGIVVEIVPQHALDDGFQRPGLMSLVEDDQVKTGENSVRWRVWKVKQ